MEVIFYFINTVDSSNMFSSLILLNVSFFFTINAAIVLAYISEKTRHQRTEENIVEASIKYPFIFHEL